MPVGLVLVAHVAQLADGVRMLAAQMAPEVVIVAAGGSDDGGIGTSFDKVLAALVAADSGDGVVVLYDLGSAQMTAELVVEGLDPDQAARVRLVDAPLVEGAVVAATTAAGGADLAAVVASAEALATGAAGAGGPGSTVTADAADAADAAETAITARAVIRNAAGLHARPAAQVARIAGRLDAEVTLGRLGGPVVDAASVLGLVAQGLRGGDEIAVTASGVDAQHAVDAIVALVDDGFGELADLAGHAAEPVPDYTPGEPGEGGLVGIPASPGIGIGPVRQLRRAEPVLPVRTTADPTAERNRLYAALSRVDADLGARAAASGPAAAIAAAHQAMLADPGLRAGASRRIADGTPADLAWWQSVQEARALLAVGDAHVAERAVDVDDIGRAVLFELGVESRPALSAAETAGAVIVAADLLPSDLPVLAEAGVAGFAVAHGGPTSHATLIARGLELPVVARLGEQVLTVAAGSMAVVDGTLGVVRLDPTVAELDAARRERDAAVEERRRARSVAAGTAIRIGNRRVLVSANIASLAEARAAVDAGADGVGLLRTELLYVDRPTLPDEDEQTAELAALLRALGGRPAVVRTLDVGGDKLLPALHLDPWRHGPLGERGLRYSLTHPDLLRTQLRAILRAAHRAPGPVSVMAPMVTLAAEARWFRTQVDDVAAELDREGVAYARPARIGVMVEVPAAALSAAEICAEADFVSVGSNDLAQYVMAADRGNDTVGHLYLPDHPALWRMYELVVSAAHTAKVPVAVCGEIAADPVAARRLVDLGVDELSMAPAAVPVVKAALRAAYDAKGPPGPP